MMGETTALCKSAKLAKSFGKVMIARLLLLLLTNHTYLPFFTHVKDDVGETGSAKRLSLGTTSYKLPR